MKFETTRETRTTKAGTAMEVQIVTFENHVGNIFLIRAEKWFRACNRCGGYGHREYLRDFGTYCFDCMGSGLGEPTTAEDAAKLMKTRIATKRRNEKKAFEEAWEQALAWNAFRDENADVIAWLAGKEERRGFIGDMSSKVANCITLTDRMIEVVSRIAGEDAERAAKVQAAGHFGTVGQREKKITATVKPMKDFEDYFTGGTKWLITMETAEGHILKTWTTGAFAEVEVGNEYTFAGTVKEHGEYNGKPETTLTRCALPKKK